MRRDVPARPPRSVYRPLGDQLAVFEQHLPAQRTQVTGYDDMLTSEQVAAMMPTVTHAAGRCAGSTSGTRCPARAGRSC